MYLVVIAWIYVALMMAVVEATSSNGTVIGAIVTFVLYGLAPVALVIYIMSTPARRKAMRFREAAEAASERAAGPASAGVDAASAAQPDTGGHAPADAVAPVRKEP